MKKKIPIKATANNADIALLVGQAQLSFNAGQYKDAIEQYKQLLKQAENKDWRLGLAESYLQRALSLADKDMVKEAIVLWENYAQNTTPPYQAYDCYIGWLLQINNITKVKTCLAQLSAQQLDEHYSELAGLLGLLILTVKPELEAALPKDSIFISHLALVRAALEAYRNNKPDDIEPLLKSLPFRSAFRDFRTLLKAALLLPEARVEARALLTKIPNTSGYHQAARLLLTATYDGSALVNELVHFDNKQQQIISNIKKFSKKQTELLGVLAKQKDGLSDKIKFNCVIQFRELFGVHLARTYCSVALANYPAGQRDFNKHFDLSVDEFEPLRLKALKSEQTRDFHRAELYWKQGITLLKKHLPSNAFKIALIMRHIASFQNSPKETMIWLMDSLEYDPNDRDSYLQILNYYERRQHQADIYKQWLDKSIKIFPQDVDFLILTIKAAIANKAFKKATQYAQNVLKVDPVNTFAKQVLFSSHLAHARKLIKTNKFHLVDKEIHQAEKLTIGKRYQAQAQLLRGFFMLLAEDKKQGLLQITDATYKINDGHQLCMHFCVINEALLLGLKLPPILKDLPAPEKKYALSEQETGRLVQLIQLYDNEDKANKAVLCQALDKIQALLTQAVKRKAFTEQTVLSLCQCLDSIGHFKLLSQYAKIALSQWSKPIWGFYKIYADVKGQAKKCSFFHIASLKLNHEEASKQADQRTATLISNFIQQYYDGLNPFGGAIYDDFDEDEDEDFDDFNPFTKPESGLFDHLPPNELIKIEEKVDDILKIRPEILFKALGKLLPSNFDMMKLMASPDAFIEVVMLHAANELRIVTGVTAKQIIEFHQVGTKPPIFPFF